MGGGVTTRARCSGIAAGRGGSSDGLASRVRLLSLV